MTKKEAVKVMTVAHCVHDDEQQDEEFNPHEWPSGAVFLKAFAVVHMEPPVRNEKYWQSCARWALLKKYGYLDSQLNHLQPMNDIHFFHAVDQVWSDTMTTACQQKKRDYFTVTAKDENDETNNDLMDIIQSKGKSNNRDLVFSIIDCAPACQFNLHAHPNLELVYAMKGTLHEIRMDGPSFLPKEYEYESHPTDKDKVKGPNLGDLSRPWKFQSLEAGDWLVNESGSIHKSFTATKGNGCILLALWSGSHADIMPGQEPRDPSVQNAVDTMDAKLSTCSCTDWHTISETFLPENEKRKE